MNEYILQQNMRLLSSKEFFLISEREFFLPQKEEDKAGWDLTTMDLIQMESDMEF